MHRFMATSKESKKTRLVVLEDSALDLLVLVLLLLRLGVGLLLALLTTTKQPQQ